MLNLFLFFQIKVFCQHPELKKKLDHRLEIHKDKTLAEATDMAYKVGKHLILCCCQTNSLRKV